MISKKRKVVERARDQREKEKSVEWRARDLLVFARLAVRRANAVEARVASLAHAALVISLRTAPHGSAVGLAVQRRVGVTLAAPAARKRKVVERTRDQQEKEKSWSGLMISKKTNSRGAGS